MIDYKKFRFATAPRTGTTWFLKACEMAQLGVGYKAHAHHPHPKGPSTVLRVSLVRNPYYWLASYFAAIRGGHTGVGCVDKFMKLNCTSFEGFLRHYLKSMPGSVGEMFAAYNADSYYRIEDMPWAMAELMEAVGVPRYLRQRYYRLGPQNVSNWAAPKVVSLRRRVMKAESQMAEDFDYV